MTEPKTKRLEYTSRTEAEMRTRAQTFRELVQARRSVRTFRPDPVPIEILEECVRAAATAPSGANKQPWTFVLVTDPEIKHQIRVAAEKEEEAFYAGRASAKWLKDLEPLGTDKDKPFIDDAPALIVVFAQRYGEELANRHYYVTESVGIAVGVLLVALHNAGLCGLTHTPAPMAFLREILDRPTNERAFCLIPIGYPTEDCEVPDIDRKALDEVLVVR